MKLLDYPLFTYSAARGAVFSTEFIILNALQLVMPGSKKYRNDYSRKTLNAIRSETLELFARDSENIRKGIYPLSVLRPESPLSHLLRVPKILADGLSLYSRRLRGKTAEFDPGAQEFLSELPRYYRRNFHFQTGGYLTEHSAELYEHQVELLFGGAADAMRRLIIPPLREHFGKTDGKGLTFLEVGAGTGRATRFVRLAFPKAKIVVNDLSDPYLKVAEKKLARFSRLDFVQGDGAKLPFQEKQFDAVYSVFLFHELPLEARKEVVAESKRILKTGGFFGFVDSLQSGEYALFDELLKKFPENYHEPFYRNYTEHPMEDIMKHEKLSGLKTGRGFYSKVSWGTRH